MHFRRSILAIAAAVLVGANALPAPQVDSGGDSSSSSSPDSSTGITVTKTTTSTQGGHHTQQTSTVNTPTVLPTTSQAEQNTQPPTTSVTQVQAQTTIPSTTQVVVPITSQVTTPNPTPQTTQQTTQTQRAQPATSSSATNSITTPSFEPNPTTTANANANAASTANPTTSNTPSATAGSSTDSASTSGNTKTILIAGGTVGGVIILAFIAFSIFRKLKLKPSREFESRMEPSPGNLEEWNDPRTFRGYMQNTTATVGGASSLHRSNSNASSKYSFDEMDEKAGGGSSVLARGNTIRHFTSAAAGQEKSAYPPMESGDGLREAGRGYRGF